jgi:hypothetical protein
VWNSTTGRLSIVSTTATPCVAPASRVGGGCGSK